MHQMLHPRRHGTCESCMQCRAAQCRAAQRSASGASSVRRVESSAVHTSSRGRPPPIPGRAGQRRTCLLVYWTQTQQPCSGVSVGIWPQCSFLTATGSGYLRIVMAAERPTAARRLPGGALGHRPTCQPAPSAMVKTGCLRPPRLTHCTRTRTPHPTLPVLTRLHPTSPDSNIAV